jgi:hypothetical protein
MSTFQWWLEILDEWKDPGSSTLRRVSGSLEQKLCSNIGAQVPIRLYQGKIERMKARSEILNTVTGPETRET